MSSSLSPAQAFEARLIDAIFRPVTILDFNPYHLSRVPGPVVTLTPEQKSLAESAAQERQRASRAAGLKDKRISQGDIDLTGCLGEVAFSVWLNGEQKVARLNSFKGPDISCYQVRSTQYANGHLIVNREDSPRDLFVLARGVNRIELAGWTLGAIAQQPKYWRPKNNSYWVPARDLFDLKWLLTPEWCELLKQMDALTFEAIVGLLSDLNHNDEEADDTEDDEDYYHYALDCDMLAGQAIWDSYVGVGDVKVPHVGADELDSGQLPDSW